MGTMNGLIKYSGPPFLVFLYDKSLKGLVNNSVNFMVFSTIDGSQNQKKLVVFRLLSLN